jgi:hypothetical protein
MPMTAAQITEWADEISGGNADLRTKIIETVSSDATVAERAVGGYMRDKDYRQKTQLLSADRKAIDQKVKEYEAQLDTADSRITQLMDQVAKGTVDVATAQAQVRAIGEKYSIPVEDLPTDAEVRVSSRVGKDVTKGEGIDIDQRLAKFKDDLLKELSPAISRITRDAAAADIMWDDLSHEHAELFGKRLSSKDKMGLVRDFNRLIQANELPEGTSFAEYWEQKYEVPQKRQENYEKGLREKWEQEYKAKETAERSRQMLESVSGETRHQENTENGSPMFRHKFERHEEPVHGQEPAPAHKADAPAQPARPAIVKSGADRAAERWISRRAAGIPYGQPEAKKTA